MKITDQLVSDQKNSCTDNFCIVFISRWKKIAEKELKKYGQSCKE